MDKFVDKIKTATGWERVAKVNNSYVLSFNMSDIPVIKGLIIDQSADTFYLEFEEFTPLPISFLIDIGNSRNQYWTVNRRLHRAGGLPAYVSYDETQYIIVRRWYWNGLLHRTDGPARETILGYKREELDELPNHYKESWSSMNLEWWEEGMQSYYESPCNAIIYGGWRYRKKSDNALDNFDKDSPAFGASTVRINWMPGYKSTQYLDALVPYCAEFRDLVEYYKDGKYQKRETERVSFDWARNGKILTVDSSGVNPNESLTIFNNLVHANLLNSFNLWERPFYKDEETEFLTITEFGRVYDDTD